ncbi:MAG: BamA/TamA family outer membrane protein [Acidobacteriota bacterium]
MSFRLKFRSFPFLLFLSLAWEIATFPLYAQYFGRNKVQYEHFDFKIMKTKHFDIYFYPEEQQAAEIAARLSERWYARLSRILKYQLKGRQPLILYSSATHFQQTTAIPGVIGEGTGGVTETFKRRIVLPFGVSLAEIDHVIGHELVHAFQFDITSQGNPGGARQAPTALRLPLWFIEGLAEYLSLGPADPNTAMWMRDASQRKNIPQIAKLEDPRYFPYRYGQALWAYITGRWGDVMVSKIMSAVGRFGDYEVVLQRILGVPLKKLSTDWQEATENAYSPLLQTTFVLPLTPPGEYSMATKKAHSTSFQTTQKVDASSRLLIKGTEEGSLNISPSLSPNGKEIIFLSTRDFFSVDMYLADALTGKVSRRITKTSLDPRFESIQFIGSAGSWDIEGKRFVFGAVGKGKPVLSFYNVNEGKIEEEIPFANLGEIMNPTWSPDGSRIAFTALTGGLSDIYIYNLKSSELQKITDDPFADLHPAWSPDGSQIAFITDRFTTDLSILSIGNYEIALLSPESGEIKRIQGFRPAKNINPQWSKDSRSIYFVSDQNGISNIYKLDIVSEKISQVTNLYTGVSGITALSPAISVAQQTGRLAYSAYDDGKYSIFTIDSSEALAGNPSLAQFDQINPSVLPPRKQPEGEVFSLLKNPNLGLPKEATFQIEDYKPKLSLDYVSTPQMAVGIDRYGVLGGGGLTLFWSDMLGYHTVATMLLASTRIKDSAALVGYQNVKSRLNWGAVVQRIPYVTGGYDYSIGKVQGQWADIEQEYIFRQSNYDLSGFVSYPFNQVRRFELAAGYRLIDFDMEIYTRAYSRRTGTQIFYSVMDLPAPESINFGYASSALVYDSSFFGATSPILGQSYILEFSPVIGSISYNSILADYRRYFMPVKPFTLAFRLLHYGRYGRDAEDERLWPLFLGYETLVRGYNSDSFSVSEFASNTDSFNFNRLIGSKMIVANAELRFPLFRVLGIGKGFYGAFPLEFLAFYDWGLAWDESEKAWFLGGERKPVSSIGIGLRTNLFGFLILGLDYVKPFSRPYKGWYFQFTFTPGF